MEEVKIIVLQFAQFEKIQARHRTFGQKQIDRQVTQSGFNNHRHSSFVLLNVEYLTKFNHVSPPENENTKYVYSIASVC